MPVKKIFLTVVAIAMLWLPPALGTEKTPDVKGPRTFTPEVRHAFNTVLEGLEVSHQFKILNKGDAELKIFNVRTD